MQKGKEFLSQLKLYSDYLKWNEKVGRYETWDEACDSVLDTHILKYGKKVKSLLDEVRQSYKDRDFLVSQRNLQWRGEQVLKNNAKIYNCCVTYAYTPDVFAKGFFVLLSGTGLGVSLKKKFVDQLPDLHPRLKGAKNYVVEDSIEGWADAAKILIASYCKHASMPKEYFGYQIKFDYSMIRPKGAKISGGFSAPGPDGLKQSLEKIEELLNAHIDGKESVKFKSIIAYDVFMHLSDAVLSGGVRRSAMNILMDEDDEELINAKVGNWRQTHPHRARSNNSVGLIRGKFSKEKFKKLVELNSGDNDLGFVFMSDEDDMFNPCFEIGFNFYSKLKQKIFAVFQFCNLDEISASACVDKHGKFSAEKFYQICRNAAIIGTLQAGFDDFPYLGEETNEIVRGEALLGVSITGWMDRPELFDAEILRKGAQIIKETNEEVAALIGINPAARSTTVKPSGNASVILMTPSGIHADHSVRYFRCMQLNKQSETGQYLAEHMPELLEESLWSATNTDYIVFVPIENNPNALFKDQMMGVKHLELIKLVKENWVDAGAVKERGYVSTTSHNVSNTVLIEDMNQIIDYVFEHQNSFSAVSFLEPSGDKDYVQAPFTSVLNTQELMERYGDAVVFMSGLIVDGLHYFNDNLWSAAEHVLKSDLPLTGTREQVLLKKHWIKRVHQFSKNYFKKDIKETIYCMKDVHLWHKWNTINRSFKSVDFTKILKEPVFTDVGTMGAMACAGNACEIVRLS
jgi:ribonucleoside-triphosphate reductase